MGKEPCPESFQAFLSQDLKLYLINEENVQDYFEFWRLSEKCCSFSYSQLRQVALKQHFYQLMAYGPKYQALEMGLLQSSPLSLRALFLPAQKDNVY